MKLDVGLSVIRSVAFGPDGRRLAVAGRQRVLIWDVASSDTKVVTLRGHSHVVTGVAFNPDGKMLATGATDGRIIVMRCVTKNAGRR